MPISNTLEIALNHRYGEYKKLLAGAWEGDSTALNEFLKIDWINDAAGYHHAHILSELFLTKNDSIMSGYLRTLDSNQITNLRSYIEVAFDQRDSEFLKKFEQEYPKSLAILK